MVQNETHFVMKNGKASSPTIIQEGLRLWYDVKGKKNEDKHRSTLLDMSGNGNHGELLNFTYEKDDGYSNGLVFDDLDDKLAIPPHGIELVEGVTYQLNQTIYSYLPTGVVKTVKGGKVVETTHAPDLSELMSTLELDGNILVDEGYYEDEEGYWRRDDATIDSLKLYSRALTDEEMLRNYNIEIERYPKKTINNDLVSRTWGELESTLWNSEEALTWKDVIKSVKETSQ